MTAAPDAPTLLATGLRHFQRGDYAEAGQAFRGATERDAACADAWHLWGVCEFHLGDAARGCELLAGAINLDPAQAAWHANLGLMQRAAGRVAAALASYDRSLALDAAAADAHCGRADMLRELSRQEEALCSYEQALLLDPACEAAHINRGILLDSLRRHEEALQSFDRALALEGTRADTHFNRGNALQALARHEDAASAFGRAIELEPCHAGAHHNRGLSLEQLQRPAQALHSYDAALALRPLHAECLRGRAHALRQLGRIPEAVESLQQAVEIDPLNAQSHLDLGACWVDLGDPQTALSWLNEAIALNPDLAQAHYNRGVALHHSHRLSEAVHSYELGIARTTDTAEMQWNKAVALLASGDWARGWAQYEWRWQQPGYAPQAGRYPQPLWAGEADPRGMTILLHAEQGLGDTLQFCRYARQVAALGAQVILRVQPPLVDLLSGLAPGRIQVVSLTDALPPFDAHCPLLSLPLALRRWHPQLPLGLATETAYLDGTPWASQDITDTLDTTRTPNDRPPARRPQIGLCWSGNPDNPLDGRRSLPLARLLKALPLEQAEWHLLQPALNEVEAQVIAQQPTVHHAPERLAGFAATAGLCAGLDQVITVDTSLAHLTGALGLPTWLLLPHTPDWRWGLMSESTVWYPSMRLWRQSRPGDWDGVLARVGSALREAGPQPAG